MKNEFCTIENDGVKCVNPLWAKGMCLNHYMRYYRHKRTHRIYAINSGKVCKFCESDAIVKGVCRFHYNRRNKECQK